jgi:hypothetical protein
VHAVTTQAFVVAPEVVRVQEEEYAAAGLVADDRQLFRLGRLGQQ